MPTAFKSQELTQEHFCFKQHRPRLRLPKYWGINGFRWGGGVGKMLFLHMPPSHMSPSTDRLQSSKHWCAPTRRPRYPNSCTTLSAHFAHPSRLCMCLAHRGILTLSLLLFLQCHVTLTSTWHFTVDSAEISVFTHVPYTARDLCYNSAV